MSETLYCDHAATAPIRPEVTAAIAPWLSRLVGNPAAMHPLGEESSSVLEQARGMIANVLGTESACHPEDVLLTSGGTEANNLAVKGLALANPRGKHIVTSAFEHPAIHEPLQQLKTWHGFEIDYAPITPDGVVDLEAFKGLLREDTTLATVMTVNNEIGTIQPIAELAAAAHEVGALFHTDAVQAAGCLPLAPIWAAVDAMSLTGHKIGAQVGVGALIVKAALPLEAQQVGGGQQWARRAGTQNLVGAVGLATALLYAQEEAQDAELKQAMKERMNRVVRELKAVFPGMEHTGADAPHLPTTLALRFPWVYGETVLVDLAQRGVYVATGSACHAGQTDPSHVLLALGLDDEEAKTGLRISVGLDFSDADADRLIQALIDVVPQP
ncbi:cysteine desulfurase family protein [Micrococcoides hystricis]|uniref:Cysteine desulfurase family protein n=1 Tax=Micrococcoides hystricis TaxID=1572761 RepID=A0ABV6PBX7_9MICC